MNEKPCSLCGKVLPATTEFFIKSKRGLYGLHSFCRECFNAYKREKRKTSKYQETQHAYNTRPDIRQKYADRRRNPEFKAYEYDYRHTDEYRRKQRVRQALDPRRRERDRARTKTTKRKAVIAVSNNKRRARLIQAEGFHTTQDIQMLIKTSKGICWWCGEKIIGKLHIDHRIPLAKGGSNWPNNLCVSCQKCNQIKNAKMPHEFNGRLL